MSTTQFSRRSIIAQRIDVGSVAPQSSRVLEWLESLDEMKNRASTEPPSKSKAVPSSIEVSPWLQALAEMSVLIGRIDGEQHVMVTPALPQTVIDLCKAGKECTLKDLQDSLGMVHDLTPRWPFVRKQIKASFVDPEGNVEEDYQIVEIEGKAVVLEKDQRSEMDPDNSGDDAEMEESQIPDGSITQELHELNGHLLIRFDDSIDFRLPQVTLWTKLSPLHPYCAAVECEVRNLETVLTQLQKGELGDVQMEYMTHWLLCYTTHIASLVDIFKDWGKEMLEEIADEEKRWWITCFPEDQTQHHIKVNSFKGLLDNEYGIPFTPADNPTEKVDLTLTTEESKAAGKQERELNFIELCTEACVEDPALATWDYILSRLQGIASSDADPSKLSSQSQGMSETEDP
ncbi:hypothetical protein TREMEDRAFT_63675 [Tremella mesenterica DSM 1558]|uniref:uncharacterized protein n=1 Tax=Tremella mesenterica (strain ATCC 24925 / CBS 8224 / DSM 1558 / NBRC 9311 / NRRL Y-6157 / RJB 2259-6 / UBC 559-6) TaxID=578456 RepID=UPI0003F49E3F|nr:uncharacterized protein TREMEDRAFT_63675 [Tremella mesenterica DSM 1558]EIW68502.1 hypothetical protein TREMEDRAFT_63675 [Tremella mesenterica DSM 1558]